jgi:microcystin-dependent protein
MSNPYIGEIRMFAGSFPPAGWAFCNGQLVPISENDALFVLLGTTYGGDGQSTFGLPDLQGRVPIHQGTLNGGSTYVMGEKAGVESVTLTLQQIPIHNHAMIVSKDQGTQSAPAGKTSAANTSVLIYRPGVGTQTFDPSTLTPTGGNQPHTNIQPYLVVSFIISLFGLYPSPN